MPVHGFPMFELIYSNIRTLNTCIDNTPHSQKIALSKGYISFQSNQIIDTFISKL